MQTFPREILNELITMQMSNVNYNQIKTVQVGSTKKARHLVVDIS